MGPPLPVKNLLKSLPVLLLAACSTPDRSPSQPPEVPAASTVPPLNTPNSDSCHAFLRQTIRISFRDHYDVRSDGGYFFYARTYSLDADIVAKLAPPDSADPAIRPAVFLNTPPAVLREFRQQILTLDTAAQRRFAWQPKLLGQFVFVRSTADTLSPARARQVQFITPAQRQEISAAIAEWNRGPQQDRFVSYASLPLFSASGRYVLIVRGQAQQSIGWDSIFIYERTAQGWKIIDSGQISTI
ncbi:hypothetical protein [Hymenobacter lucidus]|uniref:Lipoprotein n=1 Tax=Hymenobacter lucidus TaxID=2880930 RepID=A0ABS8AQC3_9BACT|nr:hypothetical protein [Hymenobacter lucidus]MCB2408314.1 hypothetical protein [Hymenobacter lucidus]